MVGSGDLARGCDSGEIIAIKEAELGLTKLPGSSWYSDTKAVQYQGISRTGQS